MSTQPKIHNLTDVIDQIEESTRDEERVSLQMLVEAVGGRSFGPILLIPGLMLIVPGIGDIPGVTTAIAIVVLLVSGQLLFKRKHLWLPQWLLKRSAKREKIIKGIRWFRKPATFIDRLLRHRLAVFTSSIAIAIGCIAASLVMPLMEVVPFGGMIAGAAITAYGLALVAHDGLLALFAHIATAGTLAAGLFYFL